MDLLLPLARSAFRKRLGLYSYKIGNKHTHKKPGVIPLELMNQLKKKYAKNKAKLLIEQHRRESIRPFGHFIHKGFKADRKMFPHIDIPDTHSTALKPYVTCKLPKCPKEK